MDGGINIFIQADINELSNNDLRILLGRHEKEIKELNKLYDYYFGESKIKHKKGKTLLHLIINWLIIIVHMFLI